MSAPDDTPPAGPYGDTAMQYHRAGRHAPRARLIHALTWDNSGTTETAPASAGNTPEGLTTADYRGVEMAVLHFTLTERDKTRIWAKITLPNDDGCMVWTSGTDRYGYGRVSIKGTDGRWRMHKAHRVVYVALVGPIPDGHNIDHACGNPGCVAPNHLRPATQAQNLQNLAWDQGRGVSGIRGVCWNKLLGKWEARVGKNYLGVYPTKEEAARVAAAYRAEHYTHSDRERATA